MLEERNIFYFSKEGSDKPKGVIRMVAGTDVVIEEKYSKPFCFTLVTPKKKFILQAANEDECVCASGEGGGRSARAHSHTQAPPLTLYLPPRAGASLAIAAQDVRLDRGHPEQPRELRGRRRRRL